MAARAGAGPLLFRAVLAGAALLGLSWMTATAPAQHERQTSATPSEAARILFPERQLPRIALPDGSERTVHSLLNVPRRMHYGEYRWDEEGVPDGEVWIRVDLKAQTLSVFRAGHEIGTTVILYGQDGKPTPTGRFPVLEKRAEHRSNLYDADMPFTLRLTSDGIAIHGSDVRQGAATHGCIGVPIAFAERLFGQTRRGDEVAILG